jgi:dolichyl-phosphate-mannose-protein mannosyltransferase
MILLDSYLLFFTIFTVYGWSEFLKYKNEPFSSGWWRSLTYVGVGLGLTVSVKWVGLFTIATIGIATSVQLWNIVIDGTIPLRMFRRHFVARVVTLIVLPTLIYAFFFRAHFALLHRNGPGSILMGPAFQSTLSGVKKVEALEDIAYGSKITIRHMGTRGGYLHSHDHYYPAGSKQQQITVYAFPDQNNEFVIEKPLVFPSKDVAEKQEIEGFERIYHKSVIRLGIFNINKIILQLTVGYIHTKYGQGLTMTRKSMR